MKELDFSSASPCLILDLGNSRNFEKYSDDKNSALINQVYESLDLA